MKQPDAETPFDARRDTIAWRQIFIGYGLVLIMLLIVVLFAFGDRDTGKATGTAIVGAVTIGSSLLLKPAQAMHRYLLADRPGLDDALQWSAIVGLLLLSAGTILAGIATLPPAGT